jgi:DNA-binding MarR family transcriptional regulator
VQEVGTCLFFTKSGATRIVNRLEKKGYIEKIRSSDDGRVCCLKLTIMGIKVLESAEKRYLKQFEDIVSNIDKYSSEEIGNFIKSFAKAVEE